MYTALALQRIIIIILLLYWIEKYAKGEIIRWDNILHFVHVTWVCDGCSCHEHNTIIEITMEINKAFKSGKFDRRKIQFHVECIRILSFWIAIPQELRLTKITFALFLLFSFSFWMLRLQHLLDKFRRYWSSIFAPLMLHDVAENRF